MYESHLRQDSTPMTNSFYYCMFAHISRYFRWLLEVNKRRAIYAKAPWIQSCFRNGRKARQGRRLPGPSGGHAYPFYKTLAAMINDLQQPIPHNYWGQVSHVSCPISDCKILPLEGRSRNFSFSLLPSCFELMPCLLNSHWNKCTPAQNLKLFKFISLLERERLWPRHFSK